DPSLEAAILSAVEAAAVESGGTSATASHSPVLVDRLVEQAVSKCRTLDHGIFERDVIRRHVLTMASVAAAAILLLVFGPAYLRHGLSALLVVSRSAEAASPYRIEVKPGNATVPRGSDQAVAAKLVGFGANTVDLLMRAAPGTALERVP